MTPPPDIWTAGHPLLDFAARQLPQYLLRQRWYPAKDAGEPQATLKSVVPFDQPGLPAAIAVWKVVPPYRAPLLIFLPLALFPEGRLPAGDLAIVGQSAEPRGVLADAFASDDFTRAFVALMLQPDASAPSALEPKRTVHAEDGKLAGMHWDIRRGTAEQSNTSIRIGEATILKVIRKLEQGLHPEMEMARFLTEHTKFTATPALLGWMDMDGSTLAVLQSFVVNQGDGWSFVLEHLRDASAERSAATLGWIAKLGEATALLHGALATISGDPAFDPEPADATDWQRWSADLEAMARRAARSLQSAHATLDPKARSLAETFQRRLPELVSLLASLLPTAMLAKTRHHGDFHLGQVLVQGDSAIIVDFEGEPLRPLQERRAKHIPLRDVAGMLRSFAYAAAVAQRELPPASSGAAVAALREWTAAASNAYLKSYFASAQAGPGCLEGAAARRVVRFFTLEKALYEVLYELANRPEWVAIPLGSVLELLDRGAPESRAHRMPHGAELEPGGGVRFRLWAPGCPNVGLELCSGDGAAALLPMTAGAAGWHELTVAAAHAGSRYRFALPDGLRVPDPASRFQPEDVHGPSEVIDPAGYAWQETAWRGRPWHEAVIYELHVGAFTAAGTFRAAIERLDHLAALGITAIEIMPVADFPGQRNWGYDGVLLYAPDSSYGRPEDLKALVDAAHARNIMVLLDVVYNHFGPDGNFLPAYAPAFFTDRHKTPWGAAVNFDGRHSPPVREFVIHNALYWMEEYQLDGLRLDAVHAILDDGATHLLDELASRVRAMRPNAHLVLENEENQARRLERTAGGAPVHYTAQWNDDLHHVLHVAATREDTGYYAEYRGDTEKLGRALAEGFVFQGQMMEFRGAPRGEPSAMLPPPAFVAFIQNHDQVGNRAFGDRISAIAQPAALRAIAAVYLLLPQIPMLFMGEEWAAAQPFPFFCDFGGELAEAVRKGRRQEFAKFPQFQDQANRERIPDPQALSTFESAKLCWDDVSRPAHAGWRDFYTRLLAVRRDAIVPLLPLAGGAGHFEIVGEAAVAVRWNLSNGAVLRLFANLSEHSLPRGPAAADRTLWQEGMPGGQTSGPWSVRWSISPGMP